MANLNQQDPIARLNRSLDRQRSDMVSESVKVFTVASGSVIDRDGMLLVLVNEAGKLAVKPSTGTNADKVIGVALTDETALPKKAEAEQVVVPQASPFTATLKHTPLAASYLLEKESDGTDLVEGGGNDYTIAGNVITFTAAFGGANKGAKINVFYTWSVAVADLELLGGQANINAKAGAKFGICEAAQQGVFYTMVYDTSKNYAPGSQLYTGAGGAFTSDNGSTIKAGLCVKAPLVGDPFLAVSLHPAFL